jgi:hypothetical protein
MKKHLARRLTLAAALTVLSATSAHAATANTSPAYAPQPTPTADSVTGTDPVPTSPDVIQMILTLLHLA